MRKNYETASDDVCIRESLAAQRFIPYFQPVHDAVSGKVVGAEMLARLELADERILHPAAFLPYVMEAGKITVMTQILLEKTSALLKNLQFTEPFTLSFNVLPDMIRETWLKGACKKMQQVCGENLSVVIELTECSSMTLPRQTLQHSLAKLREVGVRVALDDFGTGYSCHLRLQQTGADIIKIPQEFVSDLLKCSVSHAIIESMTLLAESLNLRVVAECVETKSQLNKLLMMGITDVQGFYYSKPLSCTSLIGYMDSYASSHIN